MGDGSRSERRRARARKETAAILAPLLDHGVYISAVIQCGLGDWAEGPVLLSTFTAQEFLAVEPIQRYCFAAWRDGFRGPIIQGALWDYTGKNIELQDFRTRTSIIDTEQRRGGFPSITITLDDALEFVRFYPIMEQSEEPSFLLWMDCEGAELTILKAAEKTLKRTAAIVIELKDKPKLPGWPAAPAVIGDLEGRGFVFVKRVADNGLFIRPELIRV